MIRSKQAKLAVSTQNGRKKVFCSFWTVGEAGLCPARRKLAQRHFMCRSTPKIYKKIKEAFETADHPIPNISAEVFLLVNHVHPECLLLGHGQGIDLDR